MKTIVLENPKQLQAVYDGIATQFAAIDFEDVLKGELNLLADLHRSFFTTSTGPDGKPWTPNAPATIRHKGHSTILRGVRGRRDKNVKATKRRAAVSFARTRWIGGYRLATSLTAKTTQSYGDAIREAIALQDGGALKFGTTVEYSAYNQNGTATAPARPHVGFTIPYVDKAAARAADYTVEQLAK